MTALILPNISGYAFGLCLLFCTAVIWTGTSFVSESLELGSIGEKAVNPLLLTFLGTSLFIAYLPLVRLKLWWQHRSQERAQAAAVPPGDSESNALLGRTVPGFKHSRHDSSSNASSHDEARAQEAEARSAALKAAPLWFLAQLAFNTSLLYTSVTSNTILSSASSLFTFVLSVLLLGERYTFPKLVCVGACMAGTVLVTVADGAAPAPQQGDALVRVLGDTLTLVSAALYAGYTVSLRKDLPGEESAQQVALFFGWIGVYSIAMATPLLLGALAMGWVELGSISGRAYGIIFGEGVFDYALADYLWAQAVLLLGPTVASLGLSMQIPMATLVDLLLGSPAWLSTWGSILLTMSGTLLILAGFFGINLSGSTQEQLSGSTQEHLNGNTQEQGSQPHSAGHVDSGATAGGGGSGRPGLLGQGQGQGPRAHESGGALMPPPRGADESYRGATGGSLQQQPLLGSHALHALGQHGAHSSAKVPALSSAPWQLAPQGPQAEVAAASISSSTHAGTARRTSNAGRGPSSSGGVDEAPVTVLNFKLSTRLEYNAPGSSMPATDPGSVMSGPGLGPGSAAAAGRGSDVEAHGAAAGSGGGPSPSGYVSLGGAGSRRSSLGSTGALQVSHGPEHAQRSASSAYYGGEGDSGRLQELTAAVSGWKEKLKGKLKDSKMGKALQNMKTPSWTGYTKLGRADQ